MENLLTTDNFAETVFTSNKLSMVQFSAGWCHSCQEFQTETLPQLKSLYSNGNINFYKVDVDQHPALADQYHVDRLPTFLFIKNRSVSNFIIGNEPVSNFKRIINDILNK